jgi:hypothetical protein
MNNNWQSFRSTTHINEWGLLNEAAGQTPSLGLPLKQPYEEYKRASAALLFFLVHHRHQAPYLAGVSSVSISLYFAIEKYFTTFRHLGLVWLTRLN